MHPTSITFDGKLKTMDAARFGKALGVGAREAAKAAMRAAEAAAAPNPNPPNRAPQVQPSISGPTPNSRAQPTSRPTITQTIRQTTAATQNLKRGGKRFGEAMWGPFAKLSGVLLLEVTGVLFALFAVVAGMEAWKGRTAFQPSIVGTTRSHEILAILMTLFFAYLTISNFLKASHRSKQ